MTDGDSEVLVTLSLYPRRAPATSLRRPSARSDVLLANPINFVKFQCNVQSATFWMPFKPSTMCWQNGRTLDCQFHLQEPSDEFRRFQSDIRENIKFLQVLRVFITSRTITSSVGRDCSLSFFLFFVAVAEPRTPFMSWQVSYQWPWLSLEPNPFAFHGRAKPRTPWCFSDGQGYA